MLTLVAAVLLFLSVWIIVPAPNAWLLPIGIGVPELSPILMAAAILVMLLSFRGRHFKKLAAACALVAGAISAMPASQYSAAVRAFDREIAAAFPAPPAAGSTGMRSSPFIARELFLGIETGQTRVNRGVQFAAPDGVQLVLDVHRPQRSGRFPILLQIHGGSWQRGSRTDNETFARYFANQGYVVMTIEYRLAPRWRWPAPLEDVDAVLAWIPSHAASYDADPDRVILAGRSAGAHLALLAAYSGRHNIAAVVSYYGPADLVEGWRTPPEPDPISVRPVLEALLGGTPETVLNRYLEASPIAYASGGAPPTLLMQGKRDHVVLPKFGRALHQKLKAAGARSVYLEIPWSEHAFDAVPQGLGGQLALYYTERFLAGALALKR